MQVARWAHRPPTVLRVPWTPLHAALGETSGPLTFNLIQRACDEAVAERDDLDWKAHLPLSAPKEEKALRQRQQDELAKDIAAMANSGGGMIVFGVRERRSETSSVADEISGVGLVDETTTRNIRLVAGTNVYPPVVGLELIPVAPSDAPEDGVLVMLIPDSPDRPYLVRPKDRPEWFAAPYRHGPDTDWMVERQIASAYAEREQGRRRRAVDFETRFNEFSASLPQATDLRWVIALAVPETPLPRPRALTLEQADRIIDKAWTSPLVASTIGPAAETLSEVTKRGVQRFVRVASRPLSAPESSVIRARVELHGDGTVAVAFTRDGALGKSTRQPTGVPVVDLDSTALDFIALLMTARTEMSSTGDYAARLTVHPPTELFYRSDPHLHGTFLDWDGQRVYGYHHIDGPIIASEGDDELLSSWTDILTDAVHQTGARSSVDSAELRSRLAK